MVISSVGYPGTVDAEQWAQLLFRAGSARYGVDTYASWRVQAGSGTRQVQVAAGSGWGFGVRDTSDAAVTLTLATVPSGTRWDLIVARRDWGSGVTSFEVVEGGSARAIPTREQAPGVLDEQPLALVRVNAGFTTVADIVDLRCLTDSGVTIAFDNLALSYLAFPGAEVVIGETLWRRVIDGTGSAVWVQKNIGTNPWTPLTASSGWSAATGADTRPEITRDGTQVVYQGRLFGGTPGSIATVLPVWARPSRNIRLIPVSGAGVPDPSVYVQVEAGGNMRVWGTLSGSSRLEWSVL